MRILQTISASLLVLLTACSSDPQRFSKDGREEILLDGQSVDARKITVTQTHTLDEELNKERLKRESAQKWAAFYEEEYKETKRELEQARVLLGLPPERPSGCKKFPCDPNEVRPSSTISEELALKKQSRPAMTGTEGVQQ